MLSGPSFAEEVAAGKPTAIVAAAEREATALGVQEAIGSERLRVYVSDDPVGVQLAGALKNVIAIAAGISDRLEMGANAEAALITRGLAEISRLGEAMGGKRETFAGLAGLGDLVLTCTGELSRNRSFGRRLGGGESVSVILGSQRSVVEGVATTRAAGELAERHGVEMPIIEELRRILFEDGSPPEALARLMRRPPTTEHPTPEVGP